MPTLDITPEKTRELLELAERKADTLTELDKDDRQRFYDLAGERRHLGVQS